MCWTEGRLQLTLNENFRLVRLEVEWIASFVEVLKQVLDELFLGRYTGFKHMIGYFNKWPLRFLPILCLYG